MFSFEGYSCWIADYPPPPSAEDWTLHRCGYEIQSNHLNKYLDKFSAPHTRFAPQSLYVGGELCVSCPFPPLRWFFLSLWWNRMQFEPQFWDQKGQLHFSMHQGLCVLSSGNRCFIYLHCLCSQTRNGYDSLGPRLEQCLHHLDVFTFPSRITLTYLFTLLQCSDNNI